MLDKLVINDEKIFMKYINSKGLYLHKQVYDILLDINDNNTVLYEELSSIIRYDKNLRDKLYVYLATFEENLKAVLLEEYDVNEEKEYRYANKLIEDIKPRTTREYSNLYYGLEMDLGNLIEVVKQIKLFDEPYLNRLENIRILRNKVMHHSILLLAKAKTKEEAFSSIDTLATRIEDLYYCLLDDYKAGFEKDINNLNYDEKLKPKFIKNGLCLGGMKNGVCTKDRG